MQVIGVLLAVVLFAWFSYIMYKEFIKPAYLEKLYAHDVEDKVRWIAIKTITERDEELFKYIEAEQYKLKVCDKYCIDFSSEKDVVCEILEAHRQSVIESFFYNSIKKDKALYNLNHFEYYMCSLCGFLANNLKVDSTIAYYKLYYVVSLYCANNENIKPLFANHLYKLNNIKEHIEKEVLNVQRNATL